MKLSKITLRKLDAQPDASPQQRQNQGAFAQMETGRVLETIHGDKFTMLCELVLSLPF